MSAAARTTVAFSLLAALLLPGCVEPRAYDRVAGVQLAPTCPTYAILLDGEKGTHELSVYRVNEHGRTTEKLWRIRTRGKHPRLTSVCYTRIPEGFEQVLPPATAPGPLGPGLYAVVALTSPMPFWDYYYFRIDGQRKVVALEKDPGHFQGIVFTEDGSP